MEKFGIHTSTLIAQIINFLVMVVVLTKLLYRPILDQLDERRKKIEEGLALTQKLSKEREDLSAERRRVLSEAEEEGRKIVEKAMKQAKEQVREFEDSERRKLEQEMEKTRAQLSEERKQIMEQATKQALSLAVTLAEKLLRKELPEREARDFLNHAIKKLDQEVS